VGHREWGLARIIEVKEAGGYRVHYIGEPDTWDMDEPPDGVRAQEKAIKGMPIIVTDSDPIKAGLEVFHYKNHDWADATVVSVEEGGANALVSYPGMPESWNATVPRGDLRLR